MTYAVIRFGGRQFKVSKGDIFKTQRQNSALNEVLLFADGNDIRIGEPVLNDFEVKLNKVEDKRDRKVRIGRFKSKSRYRKVKGHKQPISIFQVESIGKKGTKKEETKVEEKKVEEKKEAKKDTDKVVKKDTKKAPKKRGRPKKENKE